MIDYHIYTFTYIYLYAIDIELKFTGIIFALNSLRSECRAVKQHEVNNGSTAGECLVYNQ